MNFYAMWSVNYNTDLLYVSHSELAVNPRLTYVRAQVLGDRNSCHGGCCTCVHVARLEARCPLYRKAVGHEEADGGTSQLGLLCGSPLSDRLVDDQTQVGVNPAGKCMRNSVRL